MSSVSRVVRVPAAAAGALASLLATRHAARADAVVYDDERFAEVPTKIVVRGQRDVGDVVLLVYPYPCAVGGAFTALEAASQRDPDAALEGREEGDRGYLVVREGEAFESGSSYEGPLYNCFFFGLPRAAFPEQAGAIARLDALSDGARWSLLSRDPAVLRTGVPLALAGLVRRGAAPPQERVVAYQARLVDGRLAVEAVEWTWKHADGETRSEDPRKLSPRRLLAVEPHADRSDDEEAAWFAGALARAATGRAEQEVAATTGPKGQDEPGPESAAAATGTPEQAEPPAPDPGGMVSAETGPPGHVIPVAAAGGQDVGGSGSAAPEHAPASAGVQAQADSWDRGWIYGVICLAVAAAAGLLLRRRDG